MDSRREFIAECLNISEEEVKQRELDFIDVAEADLSNYDKI